MAATKRFFVNFTSKSYSMVLGYSIIESEVCQKVSVNTRKSLKTIILEVACLYDNLKATGWRVFVTREGSNQ